MVRKIVAIAALSMLVSCTSPGPSQPRALASESPGFSRAGLAGLPAEPYRLEVKSVERQGRITLLRLELTSLLDEPTSGQDAFGRGLRSDDFSGFTLLDPVGGKIYSPLLEQKGGEAYGTRRAYWIHPNVRYPLELYFAGLPAAAEKITVLAPGSLGEFAGIPVTDSTPEPVARPSSTEGTPPPGSVFQWPIERPGENAWSQVIDLRAMVESPQRSTEHDGKSEIVTLRTDLLFALDKAVLLPGAHALLDQVAAEVRRRADPVNPVTVEGHTDDSGDVGYDLELSINRSLAVRRYLASKLAYKYETVGRGAVEAVAPNRLASGSDNPDGRALNRRVEISYQVKEVPAVSQVAMQNDVEFRDDDGPVAGSFTHKTCCTELRVDVHPFYRDGAYLVGVFGITNIGERDHNSAYTPFGDLLREWSSGSEFGAFTVVDPRTKVRYHGVRAGQDGYVEGDLLFLPMRKTNRVFVYFPGPPASVKSVSLDTNGDGTVEDIPIQ